MKKNIMVTKNFKATKGAPFDKSKVQLYGKELDKISQKNNGTLTPTDVVDEARDMNNPLHEVFEWDNSEAADRYRLQQARQLINHITVDIKYNNTNREQKAWISLDETPDDVDTNKVYVTVERVLTEKPLREQMLLSAIKEAEYWQNKYTEYRELNRIFTSIKLTKKVIQKKLKVIKPKKTAKAKAKKLVPIYA
jgi:hypothetical protein